MFQMPLNSLIQCRILRHPIFQMPLGINFPNLFLNYLKGRFSGFACWFGNAFLSFSISSASSFHPIAPRFSSKCSIEEDFERVTTFFCDISQLIATCAAVFPYFLAMSSRAGTAGLNMEPFSSGLYGLLPNIGTDIISPSL